MKATENQLLSTGLSAAKANGCQPGKTVQNGGIPVPYEWNETGMTFPLERTVLGFIQAQVQAQPQGVAIKEGGRLMTYGELDLCSNRVADELRRRGLQPEEAVAVLLPASGDYIATILGILKAGGCYLPMDVETPSKRLEFLLNDSRSRFVLSDTTGLERLREWPGAVLDVIPIINRPGAELDQNGEATSHPEHRAYIIYTSGSTGQPKGVQVEHHSLANVVCDFQRRWNLTTQTRVSMLAHITFDVSVTDIWPALCAGSCLVIPPKGLLKNPDDLIQWLKAEEVAVAFVPTGLMEILLVRDWPKVMTLRFLITGGDRLRVRPPNDLPFTAVNGYGPAENTVFSTYSVVTPEGGTEKAPPIGRPISNVKAYVLDEQGQPVPVGVAGELYLGGEQVARGYLGRPELTAERFISDPFAGEPGSRMYRTGDWVRWLPDGELDFLGRKDGQIQIRGNRVELGEIEALLFAHDAVRQVCCVPRLNEGMPNGVVAHIVPSDADNNPAEELKSHLSARLPDYMVPAEFVLHEHLPLTPQGKADRAAMMAIVRPVRGEQTKAITVGDGLETALAILWESLLPAAKDSPSDATFAQLGGDSLLAIKLMLGVEEITHQRPELSTFLLQPTFAGLCEAVKTRLVRTEFEPVLVIRKTGTRPPLFCLHGISGDINIYFNLIEALGDDQPVYGIRSQALENISRLPSTLEAAAAEVVRSIRKVQPQGAPALFGYSWAGLLAFEIARQLQQAEGVSCFIAMVGTEAPRRPAGPIYRSAHFARFFPVWLWHLLMDEGNRGRRLVQMMRGQNQLPVIANPDEPDWYASPIARHMIDLREKYCPLPASEVAVDLFRERDDFQPQAHPKKAWNTSHLPDGGWDLWTRQPNRIHWVEGGHDTIIKPPFVSGLAQSLRRAMDAHRNGHPPAPATASNHR